MRERVCNLLWCWSRQRSHGRSTLSDERSGLSFVSISQYVHKVLYKLFTLPVFDTVQECIYNIYKVSFSPGSVQQIMH
jgi:hypothetical protein